MSAERRARLLVVDDEATQREMLTAILERAGFTVESAPDGTAALDRLGAQRFDLMITDQRMPRMDGITLCEQARVLAPSMPVVLMTAYGSVADAVAAMRQGASDYLTKPFDKEELRLVVERTLRQRRLEDEVAELHDALRDRVRFGNMVGNAAAMQEVFSLVERIAHTDVPVLLRGESGTGKDLVARAIHESSPRAHGPFVALNCAAVPESLLESEFFGHERGSFTGAIRTHAGRFEQAHRGTLFLDEIGAMRFDLQAKLLRAIQEHEIQRVGGLAPIPVDARIVAATCEDLERAIRARTFREDLFYRLNVVPVTLPPLRERVEDIPLLVAHFLARAAQRFGKAPFAMAPSAMDLLQVHSWPGNVRELENVVDRMVLLARGERIEPDDLPDSIRAPRVGQELEAEGFRLPPGGVRLAELERHLIEQALDRSRGSLGPASKLLGISYKTLQYRIRKHGLGRDDASEGEDDDLM